MDKRLRTAVHVFRLMLHVIKYDIDHNRGCWKMTKNEVERFWRVMRAELVGFTEPFQQELDRMKDLLL